MGKTDEPGDSPKQHRMFVGNTRLTEGDRYVLANWSGQVLNAKGEVHLRLNSEQFESLQTVLQMLGLK